MFLYEDKKVPIQTYKRSTQTSKSNLRISPKQAMPPDSNNVRIVQKKENNVTYRPIIQRDLAARKAKLKSSAMERHLAGETKGGNKLTGGHLYTLMRSTWNPKGGTWNFNANKNPTRLWQSNISLTVTTPNEHGILHTQRYTKKNTSTLFPANMTWDELKQKIDQARENVYFRSSDLSLPAGQGYPQIRLRQQGDTAYPIM